MLEFFCFSLSDLFIGLITSLVPEFSNLCLQGPGTLKCV